MSPTQNPEYVLISTIALGWLIQTFLRGPQKIPNWVSYAVIGVGAAGLYVWATPDVVDQFKMNWRSAALMAYLFFQAVRGSASTSADVKVAPRTNSL